MGESRSHVMFFGHCVTAYGTLADRVASAVMAG